MKTSSELHVYPDGKLQVYPNSKIFAKLAIFGCFLLGFMYSFLLLFNGLVKLLH